MTSRHADITFIAASVAVRRRRKDGCTAEDVLLAHRIHDRHQPVRDALADYRAAQAAVYAEINHAITLELETA